MPTPDPHVQEVIRAAELQLQQLRQQRADVTRRIGTIKQTLAGLANLFGDSVLSDDLLEFLDRKNAGRQIGFTRACRVVVMNSSAPLGARQVCDELRRRFSEVIGRHKDPLASVTTVLNRLEQYGEARSFSNSSGRRVWEWVADAPGSTRNDLPADMRPRKEPHV
jgi:phage tail tape-measure protein